MDIQSCDHLLPDHPIATKSPQVDYCTRNNHEKIKLFLKELNDAASVSDYLSCFKNWINDIDFGTFFSFSEKKYTRVLLYQNEIFELILICWDKDQKTEIHDHAFSECIMSCVYGELKESLFIKNSKKPKHVQTKELIRFEPVLINNSMGIHQIINSKQRSCSLHLYAPKISTCKVFCSKGNGFIEAETKYDINMEILK